MREAITRAHGGETPLDRARALVPEITAAADAIDRDRELPRRLVDALTQRGLFRLLVPQALGGEEMDFVDYLDVVRTVAEADGSVGWCLNQGAVWATSSARFPRALAEEVWGNPRTVVGNGPPTRVEAVAVEGGHRLTGEWMFSSGCRHANWIAAASGGRGAPALFHMLPREDVEFIDVWEVHGLRGTGSFGFRTRELFVPAAHTAPADGPRWPEAALYVIPQHLMFACGFACVALGVARAAVDAAIALAADKRPRLGRRPLCEEPVVQQQIGRAEATWRANKALIDQTVGDVWSNVCATGDITQAERIALRMAGTHVIRQCADVVDIAYNLSGSDAIFASRPIQRRFQDAHVITQQIQGRESHYETVGQYFLGLEPTGPVI